MTKVRQLSKKRVPEPEDFNVQNYIDKVFWMFDGRETEVTLRCRRHLLDQMIDKFGEGIEIHNIQKMTFDITVPVAVSGTFFTWVSQFTREMTIVAPENIRQGYAGFLEEAIDDVLGE